MATTNISIFAEPIKVEDLTTASISGTGVFDILMRAHKAHLDQEFSLNRIKGPEYSTVYLGSLEAVLQNAVAFLLQKDKAALDALLVEQQIELAKIEAQKTLAELAILTANLAKIPVEIELLVAQKDLTIQQGTKIVAEVAYTNAQKDLVVLQGQKIPAEIALLGSQKLLTDGQVTKIPSEIALTTAQKDLVVLQGTKIPSEIALTVAQKELVVLQGTKIPSEISLTTSQKTLVDAQATKIPGEILQTTAQTTLLGQQYTNAVTENTVLVAQECKLRAEFDVMMATKLKTAEETEVLRWKGITEKAQTLGMGVDADSVIGRQKALYMGQTDGYKRDAEQKTAKIMADTWNVRRTTDSAEPPNSVNQLENAYIGRAVSKMLAGIGA